MTSSLIVAPPYVSLPDLKKKLVAAGFEIYRTLPGSIALVERVRENLILDSGIRLAPTPGGFVVRVIFRAEGRGFPGESEEQMLERARGLASQATAHEFVSVAQEVVPQMDPSHPGVELDRFFEVACEREVAELEEAARVVRIAFGWLRSVPAA